MIWRWVAGGLALALGVLAILFWRNEGARAGDTPLVARPAAVASAAAMPAAPEASAESREQRRFSRYDKNRDDQISRDEYLASRRKAFAKLDVNGDGRLTFDEWAIKTTDKFAKADADRSASLSRAEFATTAAKRKPSPKPNCPPANAGSAEDDEKI